MAWRIEFTPQAEKSLGKLDRTIARRVLDELDAVSRLDDPHRRGKALTGNLSGLWRYRVGDYRVVCDIERDVVVILVVDVAHRSRIYRLRR